MKSVFCQQKATGSKGTSGIKFTNVLSQSDFSDSDLSLLSWLQSIPNDTFSCPFEQRRSAATNSTLLKMSLIWSPPNGRHLFG